VKTRAAWKPGAAERVARGSEQREQRRSRSFGGCCGRGSKTKAGVMGVAGKEYLLPRKKGGFPGLFLIALASPVDRTFSKQLTGALNNNQGTMFPEPSFALCYG